MRTLEQDLYKTLTKAGCTNHSTATDVCGDVKLLFELHGYRKLSLLDRIRLEHALIGGVWVSRFNHELDSMKRRNAGLPEGASARKAVEVCRAAAARAAC